MAILAPKLVADKRFKICKECEHYRKWLKQCKLCSCFMPLKTKLDNASCPAGKWGSPYNTWGGYNV